MNIKVEFDPKVSQRSTANCLEWFFFNFINLPGKILTYCEELLFVWSGTQQYPRGGPLRVRAVIDRIDCRITEFIYTFIENINGTLIL